MSVKSDICPSQGKKNSIDFFTVLLRQFTIENFNPFEYVHELNEGIYEKVNHQKMCILKIENFSELTCD